MSIALTPKPDHPSGDQEFAINRKVIILISIVAALGGLLFGFDTAIISGTVPYIKPYFRLDEHMLGWAVSCILIGCAIGAILAGWLADRYGRRLVLFLCAFLFALSGIGAGMSDTLYSLVLFRILGGLGVGAAAMVSPMYIAETVPAKWRGRLVSIYQLAIVCGILLAYSSNYLLTNTGINNWRYMFGSQAIPAILFGLLLLLIPETPRWLIKNKKNEAALKILNRIGGPIFAQKEIDNINISFLGVESRAGLSVLFSKKYFPILLLGIMIAIFQQVTGINAILYYAPEIFKETGIGTSDAMLQTIGIGVVNVLATFIAIWLVDKAGRKKLLLYGCVLMGLSLTSVALCFKFHYFENYVVSISLLIYVTAFGCTLGAVTWVYLSEIFPNNIRSIAMSVATLTLWIADFVVAYTFPQLVVYLGTSTTLLVYASLCIVAFIYILLKVPETKGKSLEEIELLLVKP